MRTPIYMHISAIAFGLTLAFTGCGPAETPTPAPCPINSEPIGNGVCQCFQGFTSDGVSCIPLANQPDAGPTPGVDAGPPPAPDAGCDLQPYSDEASRADFAANLQDDLIACSSCHQGGAPQAPEITPENAYDVTFSYLVPTDAASAEETTIGPILRTNGAIRQGHAFNFGNPEYAAEWIENHLFGVCP